MDLWIKSFILDKKAIKLVQLNVTSNAIADDKTAESNLKHYSKYSNENNICGVHHGDGSDGCKNTKENS